MIALAGGECERIAWWLQALGGRVVAELDQKEAIIEWWTTVQGTVSRGGGWESEWGCDRVWWLGGGGGVKLSRLRTAIHTLKFFPQNSLVNRILRLVRRKALNELLGHLMLSERYLFILFSRTKNHRRKIDQAQICFKKIAGLIKLLQISFESN